MKRLTLLFSLFVSFVTVITPSAALHATGSPSPLLIVELQTESAASGKDEYIKIYNPNDMAVDVTGWQLQYRSAASTGDGDSKWTEHAILSCSPAPCTVTITSKQTILLASAEHTSETPDYPLQSGMASPGGQVRLVQPTTNTSSGNKWQVEDLLGYGSAAYAEGTAAAPAPKSGNGISRIKDGSGEFIDTNNNSADFALLQGAGSDSVTPGRGAVQSGDYPALSITELLPDPASPAQDAKDEFIELYNPGSSTADATGYVLQTGSNWRYKYTLPQTVLEPHAYLALTSGNTKLTLSNSGTGVRLLDPAGNVVDEVASYGKAKTGQSWMLDEAGNWAWTLTPTPGAANQLSAQAPKATTTSAKTKSSTSKSTKKASSSSKKSTASKGTAAVGTDLAENVAATTAAPATYWVIAGVAILGGGYLLYEYRSDITNLLHRVKGKLKRLRPGK
jgi:hypothetical protein